MKTKIVVQKVSAQEGVSKNTGKPYTKYGVQDANGVWYNSFQPIQGVEGGEYEIEFEEGKFGNDLKSMIAVSQTENQTASKNRQSSIVRQSSWKTSSEAVRLHLEFNKPLTEVLDLMSEAADYIQNDVENQEMPF